MLKQKLFSVVAYVGCWAVGLIMAVALSYATGNAMSTINTVQNCSLCKGRGIPQKTGVATPVRSYGSLGQIGGQSGGQLLSFQNFQTLQGPVSGWATPTSTTPPLATGWLNSLPPSAQVSQVVKSVSDSDFPGSPPPVSGESNQYFPIYGAR